MTSVAQGINILTRVSNEIGDYELPLTNEMQRVRVGVDNLRRQLERNVWSEIGLRVKVWPQYERLLDDFEEEKERLFTLSTGRVLKKKMTSIADGIITLARVSGEITHFLYPLTDEMKRIRAGVDNLRRKLQNLEWSKIELKERLWPEYDKLMDDFEEEKEFIITLSTLPPTTTNSH